MFYSETILTNKHSPIGIAWLLATLGPKNQARKISRKELIAFDLVTACDYIAQPPEPLALRTSATLLYGVAKVYNQHFEDFFTNVNTFHHTLRRTIITDFSTIGNGGTGGTRGIDLTDDGKSKIDQITFGGVDLAWQSGLDFNFGLIDWSNPLGPARKRRASSKLDSQPSQQSQFDDEDEEEGEGSDDGEGVRRKRARSNSTPGINDTTRRVNSIHHVSDRITPLADDFEPALDLELELDFGNQGPDTSFSAPGDMFGDGQGDISFDNGGGDFQFDRTPERDQREPSVDFQGQPKLPTGLKSALKKRRRGSDDSPVDAEEEEVVEAAEPKARRVKKQKKVKWDQSLEISDEDERNARQKYAENMEIQRRELSSKDEDKAVQGKADEMVDSAGGWLEFFDPAMKAMFGSITKTGKWKWELDLAAQRAGKQFVPEEEQQPEVDVGDEPRFGDDARPAMDDFDQGYQGDNGQDGNQFDQSDYRDVFYDTMQDIDPNSKPRRSQSTDVEVGRRASQNSQVILPWHDHNRDVGADDFHDAPDSGFTPGSLHFSAMTPQEARLRLTSRSKSGTGSRFPGTGPGRERRSRSGSVLGERAKGPAAMLADGPEDESLPAQEVLDLAEEPSQFVSADVPEAFKPERLALIESQCRNFLSYVEKKMIANGTDEVEFDDVVDYNKSRKVAATAFYNCLTLTTKNLLKVDQAEAFDTFSIRFTT